MNSLAHYKVFFWSVNLETCGFYLKKFPASTKFNKEYVLPFVELRSNESQEQLLRRFRKEVTKSRIFSEVRRRHWHVSKSEVRCLEKKKAIRRVQRKSQNRR